MRWGQPKHVFLGVLEMPSQDFEIEGRAMDGEHSEEAMTLWQNKWDEKWNSPK